MLIGINTYALNYSDISAQSAILIEQSTGTVIFSKNQDKQMKPASTTKILTAICALENGELSDVVTVSKKAADEEGSSMYIEAGEKITLEALVYGLMLNSGNDAAVAIAEHLSGDTIKFADLMNKKAKEIGVKNSNFVTPNGLDDENHYVTARDLAVITAYALNNPKFSEIVKTKTKIVLTENNVKKYLTNHNKMLSIYDGCIGVKTGFTKASGRTLVTAAEKNNIKLIAVTLNAPSDWNDHKLMLDYGFSKIEKISVLNNTDTVNKAYVKNGADRHVNLRCEYGYDEIVINDTNNKFEVKYNIRTLKAPVMKGEIAGKAIVLKNGEKVFETDLLAQEDIDKIIPKYSLWDIFKRFFEIW